MTREMTFRLAVLLTWPIGAVANLFIALAIVTSAPSEPRRSIGDALREVGSTLTDGRWWLALTLSGRWSP